MRPAVGNDAAPNAGRAASGPVAAGTGAGIVVVAGEAMVDLVPAPISGYIEAAPGGSPVNVAVGLARLGVPARMLARLADDPLGARLRAHLADNGVDLTRAVHATEPASLAIVAVGSDGVPSYDFRVAGTADWEWSPAELAGSLDPGPEGPVVAVHSGSLALTTPPGAAALRALLVRARGSATISYDPNCRPLLMGSPAQMLAGIDELLPVADVVKVSAEDLAWLLPGRAPADVVAEWLGRGPALVAVTLGPRGVLAGTAVGLRRHRPGRAVTVVDTVGAGDSFTAALLAGLHARRLLGADRRASLRAIAGSTLDGLLDEAVDAAAVTCTRRGADLPWAKQLHRERGRVGARPASQIGATAAVDASGPVGEPRPVVTSRHDLHRLIEELDDDALDAAAAALSPMAWWPAGPPLPTSNSS